MRNRDMQISGKEDKMTKYPFKKEELEIKSWEKTFRGESPLYGYPISRKENVIRTLKDKDPVWLMTSVETETFTPRVIPDNVARGFVFEKGEPYDVSKYGGKDMFGIEWVYVPMAGGSMVKPGNPTMEDVNDWKDIIKLPDIDAWDWAASAERNKELKDTDKAVSMTLLNGCWFERLISFMDFQGAAMALIDEDQRDALTEMTHELTTLYMKIVDKCVQYYPLDVINIHDDWGSQMAPFFSMDVARELYLPEMKRFVDHVHSKGLICDLHSCGHNEARVEVFLDAGFDTWTPMAMNNTVELYEKYGDRMTFGVVYDKPFDPKTATDAEKIAAAKDFVKRFVHKGKTATWSLYNNAEMLADPVFNKALYEESRIALA